jgi:hypothetical protein
MNEKDAKHRSNNQMEFLKNLINKTMLQFISFIMVKQNREKIFKIFTKFCKTNFNSVLFHIEKNQIGR